MKTDKLQESLIQHLSERKLVEQEADLPDLTWILDEYNTEIATKEKIGRDYSYRKLVTNTDEAERFNYHSDYWGDADTYQEEMVDFVGIVEPYVGKNVIIDIDNESYTYKVLGVLIDTQYNSLGHACILVEEPEREIQGDKVEEAKKTLKLSDSDIEYLKKIGHTDEDIPQIEEALNVTKYTLGNASKSSDSVIEIPDEQDDVEITAQEAREILGDETFLSGLSRSAFHWNSGRYNAKETKYVSFDSSKLFRESKEIKTEDHQLYYDDIQGMPTSERHLLWKQYHKEDFEDSEEGNNKFWDWAEEEFPIKEMDAEEFVSFKKIKEEATNLQDMRNSNLDWFKNMGYEEYKTGDNFICLANTKGEIPVAVMFYGKAAKPSWHYRFRSIDELEQYVNNYLGQKDALEKIKANRRAQRKLTKDHNVKVGDIFYTYWGYDQTNSEFYEVVDVKGSRLYLKEVGYETDYSDSSWGQDKIKPIPGDFVDEEIHKASVRADGTVTNLDGESFLSLRKYEGGWINVTSSGWGH